MFSSRSRFAHSRPANPPPRIRTCLVIMRGERRGCGGFASGNESPHPSAQRPIDVDIFNRCRELIPETSFSPSIPPKARAWVGRFRLRRQQIRSEAADSERGSDSGKASDGSKIHRYMTGGASSRSGDRLFPDRHDAERKIHPRRVSKSSRAALRGWNGWR